MYSTFKKTCCSHHRYLNVIKDLSCLLRLFSRNFLREMMMNDNENVHYRASTFAHDGLSLTPRKLTAVQKLKGVVRNGNDWLLGV